MNRPRSIKLDLMLRQRARILSVVVLALLGVLAFMVFTPGEMLKRDVVVLPACVLVGLIPLVQRFHAAARGWIDRSVAVRPMAHALLAVVASLAALYGLAVSQDREFLPVWHDAHSYVIQAKIFAAGHLSLPPHPLSDFFDTFHVLAWPRYASIYFPGTALLYAPTVWASLPVWVGPLLLSAACCGLMFLVVGEVLGGTSAWLGVLLTVALNRFRHLSLMMMSHGVALLLGLIVLGAMLRWRRTRHWSWCLVAGCAAGWTAITRPLDALFFALPAVAIVLWELRDAGWRAIGLAVGLGVGAATPFLLFQFAFNRSVTGSFTQTPYTLYIEQDAPQISPGFRTYDPDWKLRSVLPQKTIYHRTFNVPAIEQHRPELLWQNWKDPRMTEFTRFVLPGAWCWIPLLVGFVAAGTLNRLALILCVPGFLIVYSLYYFVVPHYWVVVAPGLITLILLGINTLPELAGKSQAWLFTGLTLAAVTSAVVSFPAFTGSELDDQPRSALEASAIYSMIERNVKPPALILFRFSPGVFVHYEPVYNIDTARIDDAPVIRAHDLGERNTELLRYYAERQPERVVWHYDRVRMRLTRIGTAAEAVTRGVPAR